MTKPPVIDRVMARLSERRSEDDPALSPTTPLVESGFIDSFAVLEMVMQLEEDFGVSFERADLDLLKTPQSIADLIAAKTGAGGR